MKKYFLIGFLFLSFTLSSIAQTILFSEDFGTNFQNIFSGSNWECKHSSTSSYNTSTGACSSSGDYNYSLSGYGRYITTKEITLGASGNELSFDYSFNYYSFASPKVLVSTSSSCGNTGTDITGGALVKTNTCDNVSFSLDAYANQTIRLIFYSNTSSASSYFDNIIVSTGNNGGSGTGAEFKWADTFNDNNTNLNFTGNDGDEDYCGASWSLIDGASIAYCGSQTVNSYKTEAFNTSNDKTSSYAVLLDKNESLESPTIDLSEQEGFKISFYAMKQGGSANWNSWTKLYLEYWDGYGWKTLQTIKNSATATSEENDYFIESGYGYHCFTVYKSSNSQGNYYYSSGSHVNSACFHSDFKLRWRLDEFSSYKNPQVYIDNITFRADNNGEKLIPCGISYWNSSGATHYGKDNTATATNHSVRGVEVETDDPFNGMSGGSPDWTGHFNDGNSGGNDLYEIMWAVISEQEISTNKAKVKFMHPDGTSSQTGNMNIDNTYPGPGYLYYYKQYADCDGSSPGSFNTHEGLIYHFLFQYGTEFRPVFYHLNSSGIEMGGGATDLSEGMNPEICNSNLPIYLLNFDIDCDDNRLIFNWATTSEINNDYFIIQSSKDGENFNDIAKIQGAGNSNQLNEYSFNYNQKYNNEVYYRLKQVDFDGTAETFEIIYVDCNELKKPQITIYPNPFKGDFLHFNSTTILEDAIISIYDNLGILIYQTKCDEINSSTNVKINKQLESGIYYIKIGSKNKINKQIPLIVE